ncbi:hypothetical protein LARI1_G005602 [Lachnellula arida]|uniref:Uncharacterized protein n=1 Tax=Lachnellula arida TaxID=1316785 RepID=A0A8T9BA08_9HELO|nr:hypothetical protein LARI1_G005602 [Lachnellula arida]
MAIRYTPDELKYLRDSPLVVKPLGLPPAEQWMGAPATRIDSIRKNDSNLLVDQSNRRPVAERHVSRNSANPEDIILGPPKTSFMSATSIRTGGKPFDSPDRPPLRDMDSRDRFNFRGGRTGDGDNDRTRDSRNNTLRVRRGEGDQDSDGWSTVKPRKSFGNEGAERFNGRMGLDKHKDDRRFKDREDREPKDKPQRGFDTYSRDKDGDHDHERERDGRRNGTGRGRNEPSWFKDNTDVPPMPRERNSNGDKFVDRSRGWREKEREDRGDKGDRGGERGERNERGDRRWDRDRDQRQEREPEWLAEPEEEKNQAHTQEDFQKWKEQMQGKDKAAAGKTPAEEHPVNADAGASFFGLEKHKVDTPLAIDTGPDKFFGKWAATPSQEPSPDSGVEPKKEGATKAKTTGKASRFTSFFTPQEEPPRRQTEPPPAMPPPAPKSGLEGLFQNNSSQSQSQEQVAFQEILRKLQQGSGSTPPVNLAMQPKPPAPEKQQSIPISSPEPFQQYRTERQEEQRPSTRNSQQALQELLNQRQMTGSQPTVRPEQMLQDLVGQRQHAISQSSQRPDQLSSRNTDFLMGLMQSAKAAPEPQRSESLLLRMPPQQQQKSMDRQIQQQMIEREQEMQREAAQRERIVSRQARPQPPPGFYDDPAVFQRGPPQHERQAGNPPQPTQILQRPPPPPGLELGWERAAQLPPPQHRMTQNIPPPPGLAGGLGRAMPPQQQMFPPGFPIGSFPPDMLPGPPRNMPMQPPPGFFNGGPPPGFLPPISGFQGPEGMGFGAPFDGRGPPPQGAYRRQ